MSRRPLLTYDDSVSVTAKDVTTADVEQMVNNNSGILLDVRNPNELEETGKIGNAINVPRTSVLKYSL